MTAAPARCLLFAEQRDKGLHVFFIQRARVTLEAIQRVGERLNWAGIDGHYDVSLSELTGLVSDRRDDEPVRAIIGHLARAGVLAPAPAPPDRAVGAITGGFDSRAAAVCLGSARDAERRAVGAVPGRLGVRRGVTVPACGVARATSATACLAHIRPRAVTSATPIWCPTRPSRRRRAAARAPNLDSAIVEVVSSARPPVGRTRTVEILRGGRSKIVAQNAYDGLPGYGSFAHLRSGEVLERVDQLIAAGTLRSTGGRFPKLRAA